MAKILPLEDIAGFEEEEDDEDDLISARKRNATTNSIAHTPTTHIDNVSLTSAGSGDSASATLMSSHAMKMGLYSINLGTKFGQRLHAAHMLVLPLIPVFILVAQNVTSYVTFTLQAREVVSVQKQVGNAVDLANLVQRLQEERVAVSLNIFLKRSASDDLQDLQHLVKNGIDIRRFTLIQTFNSTDTVLQTVQTWPDISWVEYFQTKLKFQIQHSIFRTKIREGEKSIFDVLHWYNEIIGLLLDYISLSIHDSDVSDFYRFIIAFKNLLRSVEFSGKSGIYALSYFSSGIIKREHLHDFIRYETLRQEYVNQTFNFLPELRLGYDDTSKSQQYEVSQLGMLRKQEARQLRGEDELEQAQNTTAMLQEAMEYLTQLLEYTSSTKKIVDGLTANIETFVADELNRLGSHATVPLIIIIILVMFVPVVAFVTLQATTSLFQFSAIYDERTEVYRREKKRTEKLLTDLLPRQIIHEMKKGTVPQPESFESMSVYICDIVGFTNLAAESTANQTVTFLNTLYNLFDSRLENYDVYKVETIGDAYMVASGIPVPNTHHASELGKMALDLLAKVLTFEVQHRPGYRLKLRMGIHSGPCVAGVVGIKIPHYSIFGETVEIASLMEATAAPMKIQVTEATKDLLMADGTFNLRERESSEKPSRLANMRTFWLIGRSMASGPGQTALPKEAAAAYVAGEELNGAAGLGEEEV